jgi:plasmid stabilization system protein ParE
MRFVDYHPQTPDDANRLLKHYNSVSSDLGNSFWDELLQAIEQARESPEQHHFDATGLRRGNLKRFPVHFLFRVKEDSIRVVAIRHNRQEPGFGSQRK